MVCARLVKFCACAGAVLSFLCFSNCIKMCDHRREGHSAVEELTTTWQRGAVCSKKQALSYINQGFSFSFWLTCHLFLRVNTQSTPILGKFALIERYADQKKKKTC